MNKSAVIHARIEPQTKKKAESLLKLLGLSPTEAIRLFYRQICLRSGLPFHVQMPNALTRETLARSKRGVGAVSFGSLDEMAKHWEK